jgi:hypothetical protein
MKRRKKSITKSLSVSVCLVSRESDKYEMQVLFFSRFLYHQVQIFNITGIVLMVQLCKLWKKIAQWGMYVNDF